MTIGQFNDETQGLYSLNFLVAIYVNRTILIRYFAHNILQNRL